MALGSSSGFSAEKAEKAEKKVEAQVEAAKDAVDAQKETAEGTKQAAQEKVKAAEEKKAAAKDEPYGKANPLLGPFQFGPKLNLITLPALGIEVRAFNYVSASFDFLYVPPITVSEIQLSSQMWWIGLRGHPLRGGFFLGADLYRIGLTGSQNRTFNVVGGISETRNIGVTAHVLGVTPMLGWRWVTRSGFFAGLELGAMIGFQSGLTASLERRADDSSKQIAGQSIDLSQAITDAESAVNSSISPLSNILIRYPLPHFRVSIGFLF
jgi:hypothetical protein